MKHSEVMELLRYTKAAYSRFDITENSVGVWYDFLSDQPFERTMERLKKHIRESKFEPTIHDLLPTREERELESRRIEIARNKWIQNGGDPDEFRYPATS